tara:strand:- start:15 stop:149 length:135 start_codon:yes stop_codon:yes gene_type:complete
MTSRQREKAKRDHFRLVYYHGFLSGIAFAAIWVGVAILFGAAQL